MRRALLTLALLCLPGLALADGGPSFWHRALTWLRHQADGLVVGYTHGEAYLRASGAHQRRDDLVATGRASLSGFTINTYSAPAQGWAITLRVGVDLLVASLADLSEAIPESTRSDGRNVPAVCLTPGEAEFSSCDRAVRYSLDIKRLTAGLWGGHVWRFGGAHTHQGMIVLGISWDPLSIQHTTATLDGVEVDRGLSRTLWEGVKAQVEGEYVHGSGLGARLTLEGGAEPSIPFQDPLEVQGRYFCDERGCMRERVTLDRSLLLAWAAGLHLIYRWGTPTRGR